MESQKIVAKWNTQDGHSPVIAFFKAIAPMPEEVIKEFDKNTFPLFIKKNQFLLKPGSVADHLYFIEKGVIKGSIKEEGKMITTWINEENQIVGSIRTIGTSNPCKEYLQALEDTRLIAMSWDFTECIFNTYPETNIIGRRLWEYSYRSAEERAYICRITSAEKKYKHFIEMHPGLANRISLKHIASYLGMTQETLSMVRGKKRI